MGNKPERSELAPTDELLKNPQVSSTRTPDSLLPPGISDHEELGGIIRQKMIKRRSTDQMRSTATQRLLFEVRESTNSNNGSPKSSSPRKDSTLDREPWEVVFEPEDTQLSRGLNKEPTKPAAVLFSQPENKDVAEEFATGGNPSFVPITFKGSFALSTKQIGVSMKSLRVAGEDPQARKPSLTPPAEEFEYLPFFGNTDTVVRVDKRTGQLHSFYTGELVHGLPEGSGTLKYSDQEYYTGSWSKGVAEGEGKLVQPNFIYQGDFQDGKFSGQGVLTILDKGRYEGRFYNGHFDGKGKFIWEGGNKIYVGTWKLSKFHGKGAMMWADGRKFYGEYQNGLKHGKGVCFYSSGKHIKGVWNSGQLQTSS